MELHELVDELPENTVDGAAVFLRSLTRGAMDPERLGSGLPTGWPGAEAERETDTDPGVVYEDAEAFKAAPAHGASAGSSPGPGWAGSSPGPGWALILR
jgi:hypothetical protein